VCVCVCVCARVSVRHAMQKQSSVRARGGVAGPAELFLSINQSKILTEPHTGKEKPIPALPQGAANPASRSDTGLGGLKAPTLAARVEACPVPSLYP